MSHYELNKRILQHQTLLAELYQVLGVHDVSELVMDVVSEAANGGDIRTDEILPYYDPNPNDHRDW